MNSSKEATRFTRIRESLWALGERDYPSVSCYTEVASFLTKQQVHLNLCRPAALYAPLFERMLRAGDSLVADMPGPAGLAAFSSNITHTSTSGLFYRHSLQLSPAVWADLAAYEDFTISAAIEYGAVDEPHSWQYNAQTGEGDPNLVLYTVQATALEMTTMLTDALSSPELVSDAKIDQ